MKTNFYEIFRDKLAEEEVKTPIYSESDLEKILDKPNNKVTKVLNYLMSGTDKFNEESKKRLREVISDLRCISYKPTTFRVVIPNGNFFDLKYDPTPLQLKYPEDFKAKDYFYVTVSGKKFDLANQSEIDSAIEYINILLRTSPVGKPPESEKEPKTGPEAPVEEPGAEKPEGEEAPEETPEQTPEETK
jgi:hypothetical protein